MRFWGWIAGQKTYLLSGVVLGGLLVCLFEGRLTPQTALRIVVCAVPLYAITFRSALERHNAQVLCVLKEIAAAGVMHATHQDRAAMAQLETAVADGCQLAGEIAQEEKTKP